MHPLVIHSYPSRSYRDPESQEDVWIKIPVRYCGEAKALGRQYTKRLLPDFLIPFARMRLDTVIEAGRSKESGSSLEECCRILGCIDLRTARMHLRRLEEAVKTAALTLAERQAATVHLHEPGYHPRPLAPLRRLEELLARQEAAHLRAGGGRSRSPTLRTFLQAVLWKNRGKVLMSYASRPPPDSCYTSFNSFQEE
ncbi:MAG: hypothetical protein U5P10_14970 [Spirochaetia bacterium]|nr:hypothetical protein [Spirochaetia bacterium]